MGTIIKIDLTNGETVTFDETQIVKARILEQHHPLSIELPIGTLEVTLYSNDDIFNFLNENNIMEYIKPNQKIYVYYDFGDNDIKELGTYYIDTYKNETNNQIIIEAIDILGLMEKNTFKMSLIQMGVLAGFFKLFSSVGFIDDAINFIIGYVDKFEILPIDQPWNSNLSIIGGGYLQYPSVESAKDLLQQWLINGALGLIVNRDNTITMFNQPKTIDGVYVNDRPKTNKIIRLADKISGTMINNQSTDIRSIMYRGSRWEVDYTEYDETSQQWSKIYEKTFSVDNGYTQGINEIDINFDSNYFEYDGVPSLYYNIENATIISSTRASIKIQVDLTNITSKTVVIRGAPIQIKDLYTEQKEYNIDSQVAEEIDVSNGVLDRFIDMDEAVQNYNNSFETELQIILDDNLSEKAGKETQIELYPNKIYTGIITELDIDVTGGLIANIKILCNKNYIQNSVNVLTENDEKLLTENNEYIKTEGVDANE